MSENAEATGGSRHQGREVALQVLYAVDLAGHASLRRRARSDEAADASESSEPQDDVDGSDPSGAAWASEEDATTGMPSGPTAEGSDRIFDRVAEHFVVPRGALDFARQLVQGVVTRLPELDAIVSLHARNWRVSRMAVVDRNVLRLGAHELRDTDTPVAVVIDEAVDLARRFGSDRSPSFVNGVLDAIAKEVRGA